MEHLNCLKSANNLLKVSKMTHNYDLFKVGLFFKGHHVIFIKLLS